VLQHLSSGLPVSTDSPHIAGAIDAVTLELLRYGSGAASFFPAREDDPGCASASAICAALHLFTMTRTGFHRAAPFLAAARRSRGCATERERMFVDAIFAWADEDYPAAIAAHREIARRWPEDLLSAKIGQFHQLNRGDFAGMLALVQDILPAHAGALFVHGMYAFALEQCGDAKGAEGEGRLACSLGFDPWAQHAVAHVLDSTGRAAAGRAWLSAHAGGWDDCSSFLYTHNWWHLALFHLELDEGEAALSLMDDHVWARRRDYCQDQINAISLLARLELRGVDVGSRWESIAALLDGRTGDHINGFLDLHYLYALARSGRDDHVAGALCSLREKALQADGAWQSTMPSAAEGVVAHARGHHGSAAGLLRSALPGLAELGGSNTQRDLFELLYLDSLIGSQALGEAERILLRRQAWRGSIPWQDRALAEIGGGRVPAALARHAPSSRAA
jgi:hypothetical protein